MKHLFLALSITIGIAHAQTLYIFRPNETNKIIEIEGGDIDDEFEKCYGSSADCPLKSSCCNFGKIDDLGEYNEFKCMNESMHEDQQWGYFQNNISYPYQKYRWFCLEPDDTPLRT